MAEYKTPSNSLARKETNITSELKEPPKTAPVATALGVKELSKADKLKASGKNAIKSVMTNTVAPSVKDMILNALMDGLSMIFYPDGSHRGYGYRSPRSLYNSYNSYSSYSSRSANTNAPRIVDVVASEPIFQNPILGSMQEARDVQNMMRDTIREYGFATWSTLYDLCHIDSNNWAGTTKYGWTNVEGMRVSTVKMADGRVGCELIMPKAFPIDDMPF